VDMESYDAVVEAAARGVPVTVLRAVSDRADEELPEFLARSRKKRSNDRVTLRCKAELKGTLRDFGVHWQAADAFERTKSASVLLASECRVEESR